MYQRVVVLGCLVACGGGGGGGDDAPVVDAAVDAPPDAPVGMLTIGPAGGAVASSDGVATLTVPAGALATATMITLDVMPPAMVPASITAANPIGAVYSIGPEGTVFAVPATLEWKFTTTPPAAKDASNRPKVLFGHSRSASDVIELDATTESRHAGAALTVTSKIAHLSEHFLTAKAWSRNPPLYVEIGSVVTELGGGRHAVDAEWTAKKVELHATDLNTVRPFMLTGGDAPVVEVPQAEWMETIETGAEGYYEENGVTLNAGSTYMPTSRPKFKCTTTGMGAVWLNFYVDVFIVGVGGRGNVYFKEDVDCYDREQKPEYTVEAGELGMTRISPLAVPAVAMVDLGAHQGMYGHQVCLLPGQTITVCVGASMPTAVNYYPQYPPGFTFVDGAPGSGCVTLTNLDPNDSNCVLVKSEGGGSPNNVTVTTTIP